LALEAGKVGIWDCGIFREPTTTQLRLSSFTNIGKRLMVSAPIGLMACIPSPRFRVELFPPKCPAALLAPTHQQETHVILCRCAAQKTSADSRYGGGRQGSGAKAVRSHPEPRWLGNGIQPAARSTDAARRLRPRRSNKRLPCDRLP